MKRNELVNHIKGSYLKKQYLEAFLVQSAYIEGILKLFMDYKFWQNVVDGGKEDSKMINELRQEVGKYSLNESIIFLSKCDFLDKNQTQDFHEYRKRRNNVMHDLVKQIATTEFEKEMRQTCDLGDKIIDNPKFQEIEDILDSIEQDIENQKVNIKK